MPRYGQFLALAAFVAVAAGSAIALRADLAGGSDEAYAEAQILLKSRDLRGAREALIEAVKADPGSRRALIAQAELSLALFDAPAALAALERLSALGVQRSQIAHLLGHGYWMQGELGKAEAVLGGDDVEDANRAYALRILGRVQMDKGDMRAAQASLDGAISMAPDDSRNWTDLARLRFVLADQKGAIEAADHALKLDANDVRAIEFRGRLIRSQFGLVAALPWFERGLQINPADVPLLEEYGLTLGEAGRYRQMLAQARRIVELDRANARAHYMQAVLAARAGNCALAQRILPKAGASFNETPGAILLDAICEYELGNFNRAVDQFQRLLTEQPQNRRVRTLLAQALYRAGRPLDALDVIAEIVARPDADSYSLTLAAHALIASDQSERASALLDEAAIAVVRTTLPLTEPISLVGAADAARRNPDNARTVLPYIRLLAATNDYDRALAQAVRLRNNNPGVADAHILVGDLDMEQGDLPAAIESYERARAISFSEPVMLRLVDILSKTGDLNSADRILASYLAYNPTSLNALRLMGYRNLDAGNWAEAVALLERVKGRTGYNDSVLLANLARAHAGAGRLSKAVEYAEIAYRIAPANAMVTKIYADVLKRSGKRPKAARELAAKMLAQSVQRE